MPDMFSFQASKPTSGSNTDASTLKLTPNVLPCRIHHDGPIDSPERFWAPATDEKDHTQIAHFRGRKLRGRRVVIPDGYEGIIATPTDRVMPPAPQTDNHSVAEDEDPQPSEPVRILESHGKFDDVVVWGHEILPAADDAFVKGVEEWVRFAETMHSAPTVAASGDKK
ncbi:Ribonuclease H2 subunit C [Penicillium capsulatum]|uniref:Ribonuclease H2 subunit C n=1 Tax=Penicillium capsulatum TaxID=69766 RepID=A0A9W9LVI6_9EURO|nr:Ribonuclease H2 subunit C [Penicillium capsulatum]KAJ6123121.1 Ribonuclease H2 subunit C [Penicillium capsulatum]